MPYVLAQISDIHVGGPNLGSGERFSYALSVINDMAQQPDLVLLTGDNTHNNSEAEWQEVKERQRMLSRGGCVRSRRAVMSSWKRP